MTPKVKKWICPLYFWFLKIRRIFISACLPAGQAGAKAFRPKVVKKLTAGRPAITWKVMLLAGITFSFVIYCSDSTSSGDTVTVSGSVTLEGRTIYSGVKISLYKPVELDTAIVRLNEKYPGLGVKITQQTEFDHREHNLAYSTLSNSDGSWTIENVSPGSYHVVAEKDSFGWKYLYNKIANGSIEIGLLPKAIYLSNTLSKDWSLNNSFFIIDDLTIPQGRTLRIGAGSTVLMKTNAKMRVNGELVLDGTQSSPVKISSEDIQPWNMIEAVPGAKLNIQYAVLKNSRNGIRNVGADFVFENNILKRNETGLENFAVTDEISIINNVFSNNQISIDNNEVDASNIERNLFISNDEAVRIESSGNNTIKQNIFHGDSIALNINPPGGFGYQNAKASITSCEFEKNYKGIILGPQSAASYGHENNFIRTEQYFIDARGTATPIDTLNFRNNYWGLTSISDIKLKINDYTDHHLTNNFYYIEVENFSYNPFNIY